MSTGFSSWRFSTSTGFIYKGYSVIKDYISRERQTYSIVVVFNLSRTSKVLFSIELLIQPKYVDLKKYNKTWFKFYWNFIRYFINFDSIAVDETVSKSRWKIIRFKLYNVFKLWGTCSIVLLIFLLWELGYSLFWEKSFAFVNKSSLIWILATRTVKKHVKYERLKCVLLFCTITNWLQNVLSRRTIESWAVGQQILHSPLRAVNKMIIKVTLSVCFKKVEFLRKPC